MPDSTYDRIRKQECELCASWMPICCKADGTEYHSHKSGKHFRCTAPSRDEVIERLANAARLAVLNFERQNISGNFLYDDDHEAWSALCAALKEEPNAR